MVAETIKLADKIASHSQLLVGMAKQAVNRAYESTLEEGLIRNFLIKLSTFLQKISLNHPKIKKDFTLLRIYLNFFRITF